MITIIVADDHPLVRKGLRALLESEPDFTIVGEVSNGLEAVQLSEQLRPDVLILDLQMPALNGLEVTRQLRKRLPRTRIIVLSMYGEEAYVMGALKVGAQAYVIKESDPSELILAIREVTAGRLYLSPCLSQQAIRTYLDKVEVGIDKSSVGLSTREHQVLQLLAGGCSTSQIADRLCVSRRTIEGHRASLMHKVGVRGVAGLLQWAYQRGILSENRCRPTNRYT